MLGVRLYLFWVEPYFFILELTLVEDIDADRDHDLILLKLNFWILYCSHRWTLMNESGEGDVPAGMA